MKTCPLLERQNKTKKNCPTEKKKSVASLSFKTKKKKNQKEIKETKLNIQKCPKTKFVRSILRSLMIRRSPRRSSPFLREIESLRLPSLPLIKLKQLINGQNRLIGTQFRFKFLPLTRSETTEIFTNGDFASSLAEKMTTMKSFSGSFLVPFGFLQNLPRLMFCITKTSVGSSRPRRRRHLSQQKTAAEEISISPNPTATWQNFCNATLTSLT